MINCPNCSNPIDEHEAGTCLDEWIAKDVMGFRQHMISELVWVDESTHQYIQKKDWLPSTDIRAAWDVVKKLNRNGYIVEIINDCVAWNVCFMNIDSDKKYVSDWKCSLETQICRAALKAVANA